MGCEAQLAANAYFFVIDTTPVHHPVYRKYAEQLLRYSITQANSASYSSGTAKE